MSELKLSALSVVLDTADAVPTEAHILPAHDFVPDDGRPMDVEAWRMSAEIAASLIAKLQAKKTDTVIDYEHQSLFTALNGKPSPAAGWFSSAQYRPESGLWITGISWTSTAKTLISQKEYRYFSAVFTYDKNGVIQQIVSVALTNTPALDGLHALTALNNQFTNQPQGDLPMSQQTSQQEIATLSSQLKSAEDKVVALSQEIKTSKEAIATLTQQVETLQAEKVAAAAAAEKKQHTDLLQTALSDGRIAPAQKSWAEKLSLVALTEYLEASTPLIQPKQAAGGHQTDGAQHGLTETELAMCSRMGVTPEAFAATKTSMEKQRQVVKA